MERSCDEYRVGNSLSSQPSTPLTPWVLPNECYVISSYAIFSLSFLPPHLRQLVSRCVPTVPNPADAAVPVQLVAVAPGGIGPSGSRGGERLTSLSVSTKAFQLA